MAGVARSSESLALSVHGPVGVLDLVVPSGAAASDVAREYADQCGLASVPLLHTRLGAALHPDVALAEAGVGTGDVLVATVGPGPAARRDAPAPYAEATASAGPPGPLSVLWLCVAVAVAALAAWSGSRSTSSTAREMTVGLLAAGAVLGVLPVGRLAPRRVLAAPAFAGAAAFVVAWDPDPERLPTVVGVAALTAAVAAAVGRALERRNEEVLRVWIVVGSLVFLVTCLAALLGLPPRVSWTVLLVGALLAARFVPGFAVDVPDSYLIDLERLAVTAWSARDRLPGRRGRSVVPRGAVAAVAARGARIVTAASAAVLAVVAVAAPMLLLTTPLAIDRVGARVLVLLTGCGLLLAARSYRHVAARALLRTAGLACGLALLVAIAPVLGGGAGAVVAGGAVLLAGVLVVAAVATGRGWRSAWWSRRAEVAEALCGSAAVASVLVASGVFRSLWESIHIQV